MTWLITGGCGYIGSHVVRAFQNAGNDIIVLDSLINGNRNRISKSTKFVLGDIRDQALLDSIFQKDKIDGVIHFAALKSVSESIKNPDDYIDINTKGTETILCAASKFRVEKFIFSSTAAVYDADKNDYVNENSEVNPASPYGLSKLLAENYLEEMIKKGEIAGTSLRFFNVAGSQTRKLSETSGDNLIPRVIKMLTAGIAPEIFGTEYSTPDGTCIRDFVHVKDVARAHVLLASSKQAIPTILNVGTGEGYSVRYIVDNIQQLMKTDLRPRISPPRMGDCEKLVSDPGLFRDTLGFSCDLGIQDMLKSEVANR